MLTWKVASMMVWMSSSSSAWAFTTPDTGDTAPLVDTSTTPTGDSGTTSVDTDDTDDTDTGDTTDVLDDTAATFIDTYTCPDCLGAADLAGDQGGSPCGDCTTGSAPPWLAVMALLGLARRRRSFPHA